MVAIITNSEIPSALRTVFGRKVRERTRDSKMFGTGVHAVWNNSSL